MTIYQKGARAEREAKKELEGVGFNVLRASQSRGLVDLVAYNRRKVRFIQVKCSNSMTNMFKTVQKELAEIELPLYGGEHSVYSVELWIRRKGVKKFEKIIIA